MNLIAIDFGTERTKIAYFDPRTEQPELVRIGEDVPYWPSLFHISSDGNVSVGDDANKLREDSPGGVVDDLKRRFRDTAIRRNKKKKTPTELLCELFTKLRETANRTASGFGSDPVTSVVLTHPASFGPGDKKVMESAAKDSGFKSVTLISEPVAAALFWMDSKGTQQDNVVVLDCGGGTVDWAFLRKGTDGLVVDPQFPPGGNDKLGGRNIDDEILEYVTECLENQADLKGLTKLKRMKSWFRDRIRRKKELFNQTSYEQDISVTKKKISLAKGRVTAEERFVQQVLTHIKAYIEPIKNDLGENPAILLVGGSANLKGIREQVEQETQCEVVKWDRCDFAPVLGAVSYGHGGMAGSKRLPSPFTSEQLMQRRSKLKMLSMLQIRELMQQFNVVLPTRLLKHDLVDEVSNEVKIETASIDSFMSDLVKPNPPVNPKPLTQPKQPAPPKPPKRLTPPKPPVRPRPPMQPKQKGGGVDGPLIGGVVGVVVGIVLLSVFVVGTAGLGLFFIPLILGRFGYYFVKDWKK